MYFLLERHADQLRNEYVSEIRRTTSHEGGHVFMRGIPFQELKSGGNRIRKEPMSTESHAIPFSIMRITTFHGQRICKSGSGTNRPQKKSW